MALGFYFAPEGMTTQQYDETIRRLEQAGQGNPPGRQFHFCFEESHGLRVFDVWESQAAFEKFGETLMPILGELGIDAGEPMVAPIYNTIVGS